jgi:hypothetical protein
MLGAAVEGKLNITFSDPALEVKRQALLQQHTQTRPQGRRDYGRI